MKFGEKLQKVIDTVAFSAMKVMSSAIVEPGREAEPETVEPKTNMKFWEKLEKYKKYVGAAALLAMIAMSPEIIGPSRYDKTAESKTNVTKATEVADTQHVTTESSEELCVCSYKGMGSPRHLLGTLKIAEMHPGETCSKYKQSTFDKHKKMGQRLINGDINENDCTLSSWIGLVTGIENFFENIEDGVNQKLFGIGPNYYFANAMLEERYEKLQLSLPLDKLKQVKPTLRNIFYASYLSYGGLPAAYKIIDGEKYSTMDKGLHKFMRVKPVDGFIDISMHGIAQGVDIAEGGNYYLTAHDFAKVIKHLGIKIPSSETGVEGVHRVTGIRLLSCSTGNKEEVTSFDIGLFAQSLADHLGVTVLAPKDTVYVNRPGMISVDGPWRQWYSNNRWELHEPQVSFECPDCKSIQKFTAKLKTTIEQISENERSE